MSLIERLRATAAPWIPPLAYGAVAAVIGAALSLVLPPTFVSRAEVALSSAGQNSLSSSLLGLAQQFGLASAAGQGTPDFVAALLTSENLLEVVVKTPFPHAVYAGMPGTECDPGARACDLVSIWAVSGKNPRDSLERAARALLKSFRAGVNPTTGLVELSVRGRTPLLAKAIADRLLRALDSTNLALQRATAESQFGFLDTQVDSAREALHNAEDALARFDIANRSVESSPSLRLQRLRLQRALTLSESFYSQLTSTLQQVYLASANTASSLSVVQTPNLPGRRDTPKRRVITLLAFAFGLLVWGTRRYWWLLYPELQRLATSTLAGGSHGMVA